MNVFRLSAFTLCCSLIAFTLAAQTRSATAPPRKKTTSRQASSPSSPASSRTPTGATSTGQSGSVTPSRSNRPDLPYAIPVTTAPQPANPGPIKRKQPIARRGNYAGGYGYEQGDNLLNVGVGLSSYYYGNPVGASFEIGIDKDISVGAQFDYNSSYYGDYYYNSSRWRYTSTYFGARGSYHVNRLLQLTTRKVDLYAGLGVGYRSFRWNDANYGRGYEYRSGLFLNYFIGGKYYFNNQVGGFMELGYTGLSAARVGLTAKF